MEGIMDDHGYYNTRSRSKKRKIRRNPDRKVKPTTFMDDLTEHELEQLNSDSDSDSNYDSMDCHQDDEEDCRQLATLRRPGGKRRLGSMLLEALLEEEEEEEDEVTCYVRSLPSKKRREYRRLEREIQDHTCQRVPPKCQVVQLGIQASSKLCILERLEMVMRMDETCGEYAKLKTWVDAVLKIPFGVYEQVPVQIDAGAKAIRHYLRSIQRALDATVHGHVAAKSDLMQLVSQWISNPRSMSKVLGIGGPPGTGKTTLVRHGIAKALGRPFVQISLGGATDACTLNGHSYTYEGATWGRVAGSLMQTGCMNPVIFFDELDKVSESKTGQEIIGLLTHITDSTQNDQFTDRYFDGVPLDLSRALIIFSFNDKDKICPILRDRMTIIHTAPFSAGDKVKIAQTHLLPALLDNAGFNRSDIVMEPEDVRKFIDFVPKEDGVRNLKRAIESAVMKLNVLRLTGGSLRDGKSDAAVPELPYRIQNLSFPFRLSGETIPTLVSKAADDNNAPPPFMYT